jgi:hypothetical protein
VIPRLGGSPGSIRLECISAHPFCRVGVDEKRKARGAAPARAAPLHELPLLQVDGRGLASIAAFKLKAHLLTFMQIAHTGALDRRDVNKHIPRAVVGLNKAVTLLGVEPFHGPDRYCVPSENKSCRRSEASGGSNFSRQLAIDHRTRGIGCKRYSLRVRDRRVGCLLVWIGPGPLIICKCELVHS